MLETRLHERRAAAEQELMAAIERAAASCAVVGLGFIGTAVAGALLDAGLPVRAYDRSEAVVARFAAGERRPSLRSLGTDDDALAGAEVVHLAVAVQCADRPAPALEPLRAVAASLRRHPLAARLVVLPSTVPPGTTRWLAGELADETTFVAHCPERLQPGNDSWTIRNTPHVVAGVDAAATRLALTHMRRVSARVDEAAAPEVTELAKLMENAFIAVGVALAGEIAQLAHAHGVAGTDVARA